MRIAIGIAVARISSTRNSEAFPTTVLEIYQRTHGYEWKPYYGPDKYKVKPRGKARARSQQRQGQGAKEGSTC